MLGDKLWAARHRCLALALGAGLATSLLALTPQAAHAAEPCPNEQLRHESRIHPTTHEPFDLQLPECRAYEMVSPLEKQDHIAWETVRNPLLAVATNGDAVEWNSQGAFAGANNYQVHSFAPSNPYVTRRSTVGWLTSSADPPADLMEEPGAAYDSVGVFSPSLSYESVCGEVRANGSSFRCAQNALDGSWLSTQEWSTAGTSEAKTTAVGASRNGEVYVFQAEAGEHLLPADTSSVLTTCEGEGRCGGIYEVAGIGSSSPVLSLVDVNSNQEMIGPENATSVGADTAKPYGGAYQAVSTNGETIFFTATPKRGVPTLYARLRGTETVVISNPSPSECTTCSTTPAEGRFQGASSNGERVFFTTSQQLLNSDTDSTSDLYEYDFAKPSGHELTQVSAGGLGDTTSGSGAQVAGVVSVAEDGAHIYYVAHGVLTTLPNALGQTAEAGADNLYAFDTETGETKFVATLSSSDQQLWGVPVLSGESGIVDVHAAQANPNGDYLIFDTSAPLITSGAEADTSGMQQVYRYAFVTGRLVRVSVGHEGYADNGNVSGLGAVVPPTQVVSVGSAPTANETDRGINEEGMIVAFESAAELQSDDAADGASPAENCSANGSGALYGAGCEVYLWRECPNAKCTDGNAGEVDLISDGVNFEGVAYAGMSASGSDIFFQTSQQLVGQDTDELGDIYDARIDGGFPAPAPEPSCAGEECQGTPTAGPTFATPNSITTAPSGNLSFATVESAPTATAAVKITSHSSKTVTVSAPAAGSLALSGTGLVGTKKTAAKAGTYTLALTLAKSERKLLAKHKSVTLTVTVRFTPTPGTPSSATAKLTIKSQPKKSNKKSTKKK